MRRGLLQHCPRRCRRACAPAGSSSSNSPPATTRREEFGRHFTALGFRAGRAAPHEGCGALEQGAINLVVNCEPEGLAHSFDIVHGGSVCAIGAGRARPGGRRLRGPRRCDIPRFTRPWGRTNGKSPALRAVGGSLLYLVDEASRDAMWARRIPACRCAGPQRTT